MIPTLPLLILFLSGSRDGVNYTVQSSLSNSAAIDDISCPMSLFLALNLYLLLLPSCPHSTSTSLSLSGTEIETLGCLTDTCGSHLPPLSYILSSLLLVLLPQSFPSDLKQKAIIHAQSMCPNTRTILYTCHCIQILLCIPINNYTHTYFMASVLVSKYGRFLN